MRFSGRSSGATAAAVIGLATAGCSGATTDSGDPGEIVIVLSVSGGIAATDWQITIDGSRGVIVGDRCEGLNCDWGPGETLATVTGDEISALAVQFVASGFFSGPREFGSQCCDQFDYVLRYTDDDDDRDIQGSDGTLPERLRDLIDAVRRFVDEARV
jgi:hypothetical protein